MVPDCRQGVQQEAFLGWIRLELRRGRALSTHVSDRKLWWYQYSSPNLQHVKLEQFLQILTNSYKILRILTKSYKILQNLTKSSELFSSSTRQHHLEVCVLDTPPRRPRTHSWTSWFQSQFEVTLSLDWEQKQHSAQPQVIHPQFETGLRWIVISRKKMTLPDLQCIVRNVNERICKKL